MSGPLDGIRVLDMTSVLMGPYATQVLGDLGADVIKVESPSGDVVRGIGPMRHPRMGGGFLHVNRNKRSVALDLKKPEALEVLFRLAADSDVLIFNVRPQAMARLGLTYEALSKVNPRLVFTALVGYGEGGPYAGMPAYDDLIQGLIGLPSLIAQIGDGTPRYVPLAFVDRAVGVSAANAVTAALYRREKSGVGQSIEIPMFETMVPFVLGEHMGGATFVPSEGAMGYSRQLAPERTPFATSDGHVCVVIYNDKQWRSFFALMDRLEEFESDPRFADIGSRTRHIGALYALVADVMCTRSTADWLALLPRNDIPAVRLHTLESLMQDPHLKAVDYFKQVEHASEGSVVSMAIPGRWSESRPEIRRGAPRLGEHTAQVLAEAGYAEDQLTRLQSTGAIVMAPQLEGQT
ncbi:CoA transferase [Comamonadaceae bacterium G21597-S1]|nr:CoA transferase [Comamonadaceae bacterium G21597-S1]